MKVGNICNRQVVAVSPRTELIAAAELMREKHVGFLVVVEPQVEPEPPNSAPYGPPVGVLTDGDIIVCVVAQRADPQQLTVADVMTRGPATVAETDSLDRALHTMREMGVRRLPVVSSGGLLTGVISLDDAIDLLAGQILDVSGALRREQRIEGMLRP
jgi:CBS domain-containing protein